MLFQMLLRAGAIHRDKACYLDNRIIRRPACTDCGSWSRRTLSSSGTVHNRGRDHLLRTRPFNGGSLIPVCANGVGGGNKFLGTEHAASQRPHSRVKWTGRDEETEEQEADEYDVDADVEDERPPSSPVA